MYQQTSKQTNKKEKLNHPFKAVFLRVAEK
jgi:hypothetical protein